MKTLLIASALVAATALTPSIAQAHDFGHDVTCRIVDTRGNNLLYSFADNTVNTDGSPGGTVVETTFIKNGTMVASMPGMRPIWMYSRGPYGIDIVQRSDPRWRITYSNGYATLLHDGYAAGQGSCTFPVQRQTQATVGDMGQQ
jgi:hypothetical protein